MSKELLGSIGALVLGFLWIWWRLEWRIDNFGARWDRLPLSERLGAAVVVICWTIIVEVVARNTGE